MTTATSNIATEAQLKNLRRIAHKGLGWDFENDLLKMAGLMGFPVARLEDLTRAQATKMITRIDTVCDPERALPKWRRP